MLVSHLRRFIYLKTAKTAGTSVEIYLEPHCRDDGRTPTHSCEQHVSSAGIVGSRGVSPMRYYNHMPAESVRDVVGLEIWNDYTKIACIRNPFDKLVSAFWMLHRSCPHEPAIIKERFRRCILESILPTDRAVYTIGGALCCDVFIRYESLLSDLATLCHRLNIPFQPSALGRYKSDLRPQHVPLASYYDEETIAKVRMMYAENSRGLIMPTNPQVNSNSSSSAGGEETRSDCASFLAGAAFAFSLLFQRCLRSRP